MPSFRQTQFSEAMTQNPKAKDFLGELAKESYAVAGNLKEIASGFARESGSEAGRIAGEVAGIGRDVVSKGSQVGADLASFAARMSPAGLGAKLGQEAAGRLFPNGLRVGGPNVQGGVDRRREAGLEQ